MSIIYRFEMNVVPKLWLIKLELEIYCVDGEISVSFFVFVFEIIRQQFKMACSLQTRVILVRHKQRNLERKTLDFKFREDISPLRLFHFLNPNLESARYLNPSGRVL